MEAEHQFFSDAEEPEKTYAPPKNEKKPQNIKKLVDTKKRYIAFVGNLPFTATKEDLEVLFKSLEVVSIRFLTDKVTKKPKGIAFVEFSDSQNLEKALEMHRTKVQGRKINIELTVGGGGNKSAVRKEKINAKNKKYQAEKKGSSDQFNQ